MSKWVAGKQAEWAIRWQDITGESVHSFDWVICEKREEGVEQEKGIGKG